MPEMSEDELVSLIKTKTGVSETSLNTIEDERENSLKYYNQDLYGNEQEGRSQVVTSDVRDTIEWILPQLMEMFIGSDNPVVFVPQNDDDIDKAKQESKYINYVYNQQNDGFLNTYTWFKDALLQKNGIMKSFWDEDVQETKEEYENQNFGELGKIIKDDELEIKKITIELEEAVTFKSVDAFNAAIKAGTVDISDLELTFSVEAMRSENLSQVCIRTVAPENFTLTPVWDSLNLQDCPFVREDMYIMASDLVVDGYDRDLVNDIPAEDQQLLDSEAQIRYKKEGGLLGKIDNTGDDDATRQIKVSDVYIRADWDGDGIAELRYVKLAGDTEVLENEEVDAIPYFAITPNILSHKFFGMSIADMIADLQKLKSTLWRQSLDSLYLSNNPRTQVVRGQVEIDDLLTSRPGGIIRSDSLDSMREVVTPFVGANALPMMEVIDKMREERTGVSPITQGLNPDALADSTNLVATQVMNAAQARIKMIARIFAETGFKWLSLHNHALILKHEDNKKIADLGDGFVEVDPTSWKTRRNMKAKVGVGHADKTERIVALESVMNKQQQLFAAGEAAAPLLNVQNVYNALQDFQELIDTDARDRYFSNPKDFVPPPPPEDIASEALEIAEAEVTLKATKEAADHDLDVEKFKEDVKNNDRKFTIEQAKLLLEAGNNEQERELKALFKMADIEERGVNNAIQEERAGQQGQNTTE